MGGTSHSALSCSGRVLPVRGTPFVAFIDLNAQGRITRFILEWVIGAPLGDDTLRTTRIDSAYAEAQAFVTQHLGSSMTICQGTPLWRTSEGVLLATPPRRQRMHFTPSYPPQPPGPEYASWALIMDAAAQPTADQCAAPPAPRG